MKNIREGDNEEEKWEKGIFLVQQAKSLFKGEGSFNENEGEDMTIESTKIRMEKILKQAQRGEDFAKLAKQYTEDPGSKENGGLYENFPRGQMVKSFEDASFSVPVGEISDIVETNYGYHIIKVIGRQKNDAPLEEVRDKLVNKMQNSNRNGLITDHIKELKEKSNFKLTAL